MIKNVFDCHQTDVMMVYEHDCSRDLIGRTLSILSSVCIIIIPDTRIFNPVGTRAVQIWTQVAS